ncbi:hypothetical protein, partial [Methanoregula sp.]|uniref:hypothetical protein n=1 Tax=Methanoregula sp. TaxID=2052170 RepID=UPI0026011251
MAISGASERSPLARLVFFMVCISIAGGVVAGISAYAAGQQQPPAPSNVCSYQMDADCRVYACDDVCASPAQYRPPSAECEA